jgi:molybdopterin converting factor subunit 1
MVYFAQAREAAGKGSEEMLLAGTPTVGAALAKAFSSHPKLGALEKIVRVAVNEEITSEDVPLRDGDRVALLPPVVGG